ncbi:hypothetical protein WAK64_04010 [Bacillus spongiae]|uniref:Uncharacterized protein n=1 Tax=Bacillus spongiae TaxID=2683610 RepID=A0ABU8HAR4_9BACI
MSNSKFKDNGESIDYFIVNFSILLECLTCNKVVVATRNNDEELGFRFICCNCGIVHKNNPMDSWERDTFYGFNTWLNTNCCGQTLWAYNKEHLHFMEGYILSTLRERVPNLNQSLASRLPNWMKSAKNREELTNGFKILRKKLAEAEKLLK